MRSSKAAFDLIVAEEVTSEAVYKKKYRRPEWPGVQSGATVGIGYDLGQTSAATIRADWSGRVPDAMLDAMVSASGKTGPAGKKATAKIRDAVDIPWDVALAVHEERVVPRWEAKVAKALPNTDLLSPDSFGAVLSLTFNRGPSFSQSGPRYAEMRAIKKHMAAKDFAAIPGEFRAMKRIWPKVAGLRRRRDTEAKLFERGLKEKALPPSPKFGEYSVEVEIIEKSLDALGYHDVGMPEGIWNSKTIAAIAAFKADRKLPGEAVIDDALKAELDKAADEKWTRPIAVQRAEATQATVAKQAPELVPVRRGFWGSISAAIVALFWAGVNALADYFKDALAWVVGMKEYAADAPAWLWFLIAAGIAILLAIAAAQGMTGIVAAFREGRRA